MDKKITELIDLCDVLSTGAAVLRTQFNNKSQLSDADQKFIAQELVRLKFLIQYHLTENYQEIIDSFSK